MISVWEIKLFGVCLGLLGVGFGDLGLEDLRFWRLAYCVPLLWSKADSSYGPLNEWSFRRCGAMGRYLTLLTTAGQEIGSGMLGISYTRIWNGSGSVMLSRYLCLGYRVVSA